MTTMMIATTRLLPLTACAVRGGGVRCYSFGIPGLENVDASRDVDHTPLFCKETLRFLAPAPGMVARWLKPDF